MNLGCGLMCGLSGIRLACRREPLNEAHDSTFGILENYHC